MTRTIYVLDTDYGYSWPDVAPCGFTDLRIQVGGELKTKLTDTEIDTMENFDNGDAEDGDMAVLKRVAKRLGYAVKTYTTEKDIDFAGYSFLRRAKGAYKNYVDTRRCHCGFGIDHEGDCMCFEEVPA